MCMETSMALRSRLSRIGGTKSCSQKEQPFGNPCFFPKLLQDICSAGQHCVLDIDVEGVKSLKAYIAKEARFGLTLHTRSNHLNN